MRDHLERGVGASIWQGNGAGNSEGVGVSEGTSGQGVTVKTAGSPEADSNERMARLVRTIEGEIVPRLVLARRVSKNGTVDEHTLIKAPDASDVKELVRLLLAHDADVAAGYVEAVRHRGASLELVCLELLAPAARELGLLWEEDECDFMQVTVGLCRLHQVLRNISAEWRPDDRPRSDRSILLAPVPGEQHTFGIMLVAQFLRRSGWEVWHEFPETLADILSVARHQWFAVVGLSVGTESRLDDVARIIRSIRCASRNSAVGILVGGPLLVTHPEMASLVGADGTASDGRQAVIQAEHICSVLGASH